MNNRIYLFALVLILFACSEEDFGDIAIDPAKGWFPEKPASLHELNSAYDEYDCSARNWGNRINLYYASNSPKKGADFDISAAIIDLSVNEDGTRLQMKVSNSSGSSSALNLINSSANELGAFSFNSNFGSKWYLFYADDKKGQYDIKYLYKPSSNASIQGPFDANVLNSSVCDYYPSINQWQTKMIFSSYRKKSYDLYEIEVEGDAFKDWLDNGANSAQLNETISSEKYDKCPCQNGKLLVFASDRHGGYGGYDLWYSILQNDKWSAPQNFGPAINSEYDEYGPATAYISDSQNDFMLFSSNRPGGKGGYDLYFVGIQKMIKWV